MTASPQTEIADLCILNIHNRIIVIANVIPRGRKLVQFSNDLESKVQQLTSFL
jgi:hypothetical protein